MPKAPPVNLTARINSAMAAMNKKPAAKKASAKDTAMRTMYAKGKPGMTTYKATAKPAMATGSRGAKTPKIRMPADKQRPGKAY